MLKEIRDLLKKMQGGTVKYPVQNLSPAGSTTCSKCGKVYDDTTAGGFCETCGTRLSDMEKLDSVGTGVTSNGALYCSSCQKSNGYRDANGDAFCPNCQKLIE